MHPWIRVHGARTHHRWIIYPCTLAGATWLVICPSAVSPWVLVAMIHRQRGGAPARMDVGDLGGGSMCNRGHGEAQQPGATAWCRHHVYSHWELYRKGCHSTNTNQSLVLPLSPASVSIFFTLSVCICSADTHKETIVHILLKLDLTVWLFKGCSLWRIALYLKVFAIFPMFVNVGEKILFQCNAIQYEI